MANIERLRKHLESHGFQTSYFPTKEEAAAYLDREIDRKTVAIGGAGTIKEMDLYPRLCAHNQVIWHWEGGDPMQALDTDVYLTSANGVAETGEIINIDGTGNRAASTLYGHKKVYFVIGENKIAPDYEKALWRARNIAAPKNAQRIGVKTPCAVKGDKCYDCSSPQRICNALVVLWRKPKAFEAEVVVVGEALGY